jgi:hypothetical protein
MNALSWRAVVLVEGVSDQRALDTRAARRGRDLSAEGVSHRRCAAIGHVLERFGPRGLDIRLAGLCDTAEEGHFQRARELAGIGTRLGRHDLERLGFYVCEEDIEDELIRSLGAATVEDVIDAQGELGAFRTMQHQPAWRGAPIEAQLRRFLGTRGGRKIHYASLLVGALDLGHVPRPLDGVLTHV